MKAFFRNTFLGVLALACCTYFYGCGDDDGETGFDSADLVGTWNLSSTEIEYQVGEQSLLQWLQENAELSETDAQILITFFEELFEIEDEFPADGTITFNSDNTYELEFDGDTDTGTWSLSSDGKTLTVNSDSDPENLEFTITQLSANSLVLTLTEESDDFDFDDDGGKDTITIAVTLTFNKS